jgi:hypothetical protein
LGASLMAAWFRLTMGGEDRFLPLFDGSGATMQSILDMGGDIRVTANQPASHTTVVNTFEAATPAVRPAAGSTATFCASIEGNPMAYPKPTCAELAAPAVVLDPDTGNPLLNPTTGLPRTLAQSSSAQTPHWASMRFAPSAPATPVLHYQWTRADTSLRVDVPAAAADVSDREALTFRASPEYWSRDVSDLQITVHDAAGGKARVNTADYSTALTPLPWSEDNPAVAVSNLWTTKNPGGTNLHKVILRQVHIPVEALAGVDLTALTRIDFAPAGGLGAGGVYLSDLAFTSSAVGAASLPTTLPRLTVGNNYVDEGEGPHDVLVPLRLSGPAPEPVTGYIEAYAGTRGSSFSMSEQFTVKTFTIPAGQVCLAVPIPITGNNNPATTPTVNHEVVASVVQNASTAEAYGNLTVREDDAVVTAAQEVLPMAEPPGPEASDPCGAPLPSVETRVVAAAGLTASGAPAVIAEVVGLTPAAPAPTGALSYGIGGGTIGASELGTDGGSDFALPADLAPGTHLVTVSYPGDPVFRPASALVSVWVAAPAAPTPTPTVTVWATQTATPEPSPAVTVTLTPEPAPTVTLTPEPAPTVTVTPKTADAGQPPAPTKVTTRSVTLTGKAFKAKTRPKLTAKVVLSNGAAPKGKVVVYVGGKKVKTVKLTAAKKGKLSIVLPKRYAKAIKVKAVFQPSSPAAIGGKTSKTVKVKVKR